MNTKLLLPLLLLLALCACGAQDAGNAPYTETRNGKDYVVDREAGTVSDGQYTYAFTFSGDSARYDLQITYPDGSSYWWTQSDNMGYGGWSEDYDEHRYVSGDVLREVLAAKAPKAPAASGGHAGAGLLLLLLGLFGAVFPRTAWYLSCGWRFKNAEPSDAALLAGRAGGAFAAVLGVVLLFL